MPITHITPRFHHPAIDFLHGLSILRLGIRAYLCVIRVACVVCVACGVASAAEHQHGSTTEGLVFEHHVNPRMEILPSSRIKAQLKALPMAARANALQHMQEYDIKHHDLNCLHADEQGHIHFQCNHVPSAEIAAAPEPLRAAALSVWDGGFSSSAAVPIATPPIFNSKLGSTNTVYIDFNGSVVTGTAWNDFFAIPTITARPFDIDDDPSTFNDTEQKRIYHVWQRVAEDFAAYDINVTTDPYYDNQNNRGPNTGHILICHNKDFGDGGVGGRAYVGVFGKSNYATRRSPALVYYNNLYKRADFIAEAASHEFGHNIGFGHHSAGHGTGQTSWSPIMSNAYGKNVSQWSNGEYYNASSPRNDEAKLIHVLGHRADEHANSIGAASLLRVSAGTIIDKTHSDNQGIITGPADPDVFRFSTHTGTVTFRVDPLVIGTHTRGGNLDVKIRLLDETGAELASADPSETTYATISTEITTAGTYYLEITGVGVGTPFADSPSGYVARFSQGQYFISGTVQATATDVLAPTASIRAEDIDAQGLSSHDIVVTYSDNVAIEVAGLSHADLRVTGPNGFDQLATFISVDNNSNGSLRVANYRIQAPEARWGFADNGTYSLAIEAHEVFDTNAQAVAADTYATFEILIPAGPDTLAPTTTSFSLIVKGRVSADTTSLTFNGVTASIDASGNYQQAVVISTGVTVITVTATDGAGNVTTRSIDVTSAASLPLTIN